MTGSRFAIEGDCNIYRAAELKAELLQALQAGATLELDLSDVSELDTAGVQLLLLAEREARARGGALRLVAASPAADEVLALFDLRSLFGAAA